MPFTVVRTRLLRKNKIMEIPNPPNNGTALIAQNVSPKTDVARKTSQATMGGWSKYPSDKKRLQSQ